jgi:hypothetical protein
MRGWKAAYHGGHTDTAHGDVAHGDVAHGDSNGKGHVDTPHTDVAHTDTPAVSATADAEQVR